VSDCNSPGDIERGPNKAIRVVCASCGFVGPWFGNEPILNSNPHAKIATLRADNARLREALAPFARYSETFPDADANAPLTVFVSNIPRMGDCHAARAALAPQEPGHASDV
jgi:hypothetical protein